MTTGMVITKEKTFGPVAPLYRFTSDAEVAEALEYGIVGINTGIISTEVAPFGGVKESGLGREGSKYGLEEFLEIKYLCLGGI